MLLHRLIDHVKAQNWTAVALDFVIVVAGILIAFQVTEWNEDRAARAKLGRVEEVLQRDLFSIYANAKERIAVAGCRQQAYQMIAAKLLAPGETWAGMPRADTDNVFDRMLPTLLRSPHRNWEARTWKAELAQGTFNLMDDDRRLLLDQTFKQAETAERLQVDIYELQGRLKVLAVSTDIPQSDKLRYYDLLGELDEKSALLELIAEQIITSIETVGVNIPVGARQSLSDELVSDLAYTREVYGACYVPAAYPVFSWLALEDRAP